MIKRIHLFQRIDKENPSISAVAPSGWQSADFNIEITCSDGNGSGCAFTQYRLDSENWNSVDGNIPITTDGNHLVEFYARDNVGNISPTSSVYAALDKTAPSTSWDGNSAWQSSDVNIHLTCSDGNGSGCLITRYRVDDDNSSNINFGAWLDYNSATGIVFSTTGDGNYAIDFNSTDVVSHVENTNRRYVLIDKLAPTITINTPANGNRNVISSTVSFDVNRGLGAPINLNSIRVDINGTQSSVFNAATHCTENHGSYACSYTETSFVGGNDYNLAVSAEDIPGHKAQAISIFHKLVGIYVQVNLPNGGEYWSGVKSIDFNTYNTSNLPMHAKIAYSKIGGEFTNIIESDLSLNDYASIAGLNCDDSNWSDSTNCTYDWNTATVSDGEYFIDLNVWNTAFEEFQDSSDAFFIVDNSPPSVSISGVSSVDVYEDLVYLNCSDSVSGCISEKKYYYAPTQDCSSSKADYAYSTTESTLLIGDAHTDYLCVWFENNAGLSSTAVSTQLHVDPTLFVLSKGSAETQLVATADLNDVCNFRFVDTNITIDCPHQTKIKIRERGKDFNRAFISEPSVFISPPKDIKVVLEADITSFNDPNYFIKFYNDSRTITSQGNEENYPVTVVEERLIPLLTTDGHLEIGTLVIKIPRKAS